MSQRVFGPIKGAGVQVTELDSDKTVEPAPTGVHVYVGKLRKGDVGSLIDAPTKSDMLKKVGDYIAGSQVPDAALDCYGGANGRCEIFFIRLTDGTEVQASETFFSRHLGHGYFAGPYEVPTWGETKRPLFKLKAKNGGRWGGRGHTLTGAVDDFSTDIAATVVTTGQTMLEDEWVGATLRLVGVTGKTYEVISNTTTGDVTVQLDQDMASDLANSADPTVAGYELVLDSEVQTFPTQLAGTRRALSALLKDGEEDEIGLFGLEVYEDQVKVLEYPNLSLDPSSKWYAETVINEDTSNFCVEFETLFAGTVDADIRGANWYGAAQEWASDTVTVQIAHVRSVSADNDSPGWVGNFTMPSPARVKKQKITLTFSDSDTYSVTTDADDGAEITALEDGEVGTAYDPANRYTVGFTVFEGVDAWTAGDTIVIDVLPLPVDEDGEGLLAGRYIYPDVGSDSRLRFQIDSNTSNEITLSSAPSPTPDQHEAASTSIDTGALTFPLTLTDTTLLVQHSTFGTVSLTLASGPHADAADLADEINTKWQAAVTGAGDIAADGGSAHLLLHLDDGGDDTEVGYESFLIVAQDNDDLALTAGMHVIGALGAEFRVQARTELIGGYDGTDPVDADYIATAVPAQDSLISRLFGQNKGLVKLATPGVTTTAVQKAFLELAAAYSYQYRVEIPSSVTDDAAAVAYINDTIGRSDFGVTSFPSYAYVPNPQGSGAVLRTLTGAIHGREALVASNFAGYHKVAAGIDITLPAIIRLPTGDRVLNEEILTPQGINVIKKLRGNFVIWGARTIALDPAWKWKQQRELMSHYERQLLESMDFVIFAINDPITQLSLVTTLQTFFLPEWQKRALRGDTFQDACQIVIDSGNNTNLTRSQGDLFADIKLRLADTVERFRIRLGKAGVFEDLG